MEAVMNKHAYLIQAHDDFYILEHLIKMIDNEVNDIYIHIDKKVKDFDFNYYKNLAKKSSVYFTKRIDVRWGSYKQIQSELILFTEAYKKHYTYYHLLSGIDLIIKPSKEIYEFFEKNKGYEFITFDNHNKVMESAEERINYYHFFTNNFRSKNRIIHKISCSLHSRIINFQKSKNIKRKVPFEIRKGSNWVSITDELVGYILQNKAFIKKYFKNSYCADELFIQTLVYNSKFYEKVYSKIDNDYNGSKRFIDWERGNPYIFKESDYNKIINSNRFFARKFNSKVDKNIVDKIYAYIEGEKR